MNKVELVGRLTRDPEMRTSQSGQSVLRFSVAVNRRFKNANDGYDADFINCVAFSKTAEFIGKYFSKGMAIGITGRIQTGSYEKNDGTKVYTTDVVVEAAEFVEKKSDNASNGTFDPTENQGGFDTIPDDSFDVDDEDLPF